MRRIRVCTKTESTAFSQVTYRGKDGEVQFDEWIGVSIWPEAIDLYRIDRTQLESRVVAQHQRGVSTTVKAVPSDFWMALDWIETGTNFKRICQLGTQAKKKAMVEVLTEVFGDDVEFV